VVVERLLARALGIRPADDDPVLRVLRSHDVLHDARNDGSESGRALDILKERFARGEISQAQYEEQRRLLEA
jgi:uncharacterized membrane protein